MFILWRFKKIISPIQRCGSHLSTFCCLPPCGFPRCYRWNPRRQHPRFVGDSYGERLRVIKVRADGFENSTAENLQITWFEKGGFIFQSSMFFFWGGDSILLFKTLNETCQSLLLCQELKLKHENYCKKGVEIRVVIARSALLFTHRSWAGRLGCCASLRVTRWKSWTRSSEGHWLLLFFSPKNSDSKA